jgi:hypothetical protein
VIVWQAASTVMHPGLDVALIEEARADDTEAAAAEWDAAFRSDLESYISTDLIEELTTPTVTERPPRAGVRYHAFLDVAAGTGRDSFCAAVAHGEAGPEGKHVAVLDAIFEAKPPFDALAVAAEVAAWLKRYDATAAQSDAYAAGIVVEMFARHGIVVTQDAPVRSDLYLRFLPLATSRSVALLDDRRLHQQLVGLERRRRAGGRDQVDHAPNGHDDRSNAAVGAVLLAACVADCVVIGSQPRARWSAAAGGWVRPFQRAGLD